MLIERLVVGTACLILVVALAGWRQEAAAAPDPITLEAEAAQISFERGLKDSFAVVIAEDDLLEAKVGYIDSTQDYQVLLAELDLVHGVRSGRVELTRERAAGVVKGRLPAGVDLPAPNIVPEEKPAGLR